MAAPVELLVNEPEDEQRDELERLPGEDELPYSDGEPFESEQHALIVLLLKVTLEEAWTARQDFYVGMNMFVYFSPDQVLTEDFKGPDLFVALGVTRRLRKSWVVWGEGGRTPNLVLEVTSPSTRKVDYGHKKDIYATRLRVPEYFIFNPFNNRLEGWRLDGQTLRSAPMVGNPSGDLYSQQVGLWLGVRPTRFSNIAEPTLRWIDEDGRVLPTPEERADEERARADEERTRADDLAARLREYEARFGPLGR